MATQLWNESVNGDLSSDSGNPTALSPLSLGGNLITGALPETPPTEDGIDRFSFTVPDGFIVSAINVTKLDITGFSNGFNLFLFNGQGTTLIGGLNASTSGLKAGDNLFLKLGNFSGGPLTAGVYQFDLRGFGDTFGANAYEFDLVLSPPNTAPTDLSLSPSSVDETVLAGTAVGNFSTTDADGGSFTYAFVSGTGDTDNSAFTIVGNELKINSSPDFETKSSYSIRVKTTDAGGLSYEEAFTINVADVVENSAPTDLTLSSTSVDENVAAGTVTSTFVTTDAEGGNCTYAFVSGTGDTDNSAFTIVGNELKINSSPDFETKSSYSIRVKTTDAGGLSYEEAFTINVNDLPENRTPTAVNDSVNAYKGVPTTIAASTLLANDTDPDAGTTLQITGVSNATNGTVSLNSSGNVVFTATNTGNASFQYTISDGSLTSTATVAVSVGLSLNGGKGIDILKGSDRDDLINGNGGADALYGNKGNDILNGGSSLDLLLGGEGNDLLNGGDSADALYGGKGNDTLTGGSGKDLFAFVAGDGSDTITDFADGSDKIGLVGLRFSQLTISASGSGTVIKYGSETLATLTGVSSNLITAADFIPA